MFFVKATTNTQIQIFKFESFNLLVLAAVSLQAFFLAFFLGAPVSSSMLDAMAALAGTNLHNLVYGGKISLFFNTGISMPFTVFTPCSIFATAFIDVVDTHQKGETIAVSAGFKGSSGSMAGLGGGVIKNS